MTQAPPPGPTARLSETRLFIDGTWRDGASGDTLPVTDPASGEEIGRVARAGPADLRAAVAAAERGFRTWRAMSALERGRLMRRAAEVLRARTGTVARAMTLEQGKPLGEACLEVGHAADIIDWAAEEGRRAYGRVIPPRTPGVRQIVVREPVGPVAGFTPWNVPVNLAARKITGALGAGCSIVLKGAEETPACVAGLVAAFAEAGVPPGVVNLVFGDPAEISSFLVPHPVIRKIAFTGSTAVGKHLAAMAGRHMKRVTMELGGHAPALVFADADIDHAVRVLAGAKYRNAGQICVSPTRFLVEDSVAEAFTERFVHAAEAVRVGHGLAEGTTMGPLANPRRVEAMERLVRDAVSRGATLRTGGARIGNTGNFFGPTVLADVPKEAAVMNEEPFGPLAIINTFQGLDDALAEANRLPVGLAAYAYTRSVQTAQRLTDGIETGMLSINHHGLGLAETPFGGVKDSGYGSEGGAEALEAYLSTKFVTLAE